MTPKFTALLVSLFLLSLMMLFGPLLLIGCDDGPLMKCDYCRATRHGVFRYVCDKCKKPHAACDSERSILNYTKNEGLRGGIYYSATSILTCPGDEPAVEPVAETKPEPSPEDPKPLTTTQRASLVGIAVAMSLVLGFALGKARRGQLVKLENRKGVVS